VPLYFFSGKNPDIILLLWIYIRVYVHTVKFG
jgi:hypothetical protein